jgi:ribosomal-protein-serine acetyltransferase
VFVIDAATELRPLRHSDSRELFALTHSNRTHLRQWLPWVDAVTAEADTRAYIRTTIEQRDEGRGPVFAIVHDGAIAGVTGFLPLDRVHRGGEIGYWLAAPYQGRGIMTASCRFLVRYAFHTLDLHRLQIAAATENLRSRAVIERLGLKLEGILRGRENLYGRWVDHAVYSMLEHEFEQSSGERAR